MVQDIINQIISRLHNPHPHIACRGNRPVNAITGTNVRGSQVMVASWADAWGNMMSVVTLNERRSATFVVEVLQDGNVNVSISGGDFCMCSSADLITQVSAWA